MRGCQAVGVLGRINALFGRIGKVPNSRWIVNHDKCSVQNRGLPGPFIGLRRQVLGRFGVSGGQGPRGVVGWGVEPDLVGDRPEIRPLSFSQNPNTCPKLSGSGTMRSRLPLPMTRTDLAVPSTTRTSWTRTPWCRAAPALRSTGRAGSPGRRASTHGRTRGHNGQQPHDLALARSPRLMERGGGTRWLPVTRPAVRRAQGTDRGRSRGAGSRRGFLGCPRCVGPGG